MKAKLKLILLIGIILSLLSCGKSKASKELKDKNEKAINELALKYNADNTWDDSPHYSFDLQDYFSDSNNLMLFEGRIYDIVYEENYYVVKVLDERKDEEKNYIASIKFNKDQFASIIKENRSTSGVFVIKLNKVTSSIPSVKEEEISDGDGNSYTYTHLNDDNEYMIQIFNGELIDFYLNEIEN
jgi:hypothetical protein